MWIKRSGCLTAIVLMLVNITIGAWSIIEILSWFGKSIPTIACAVIGLFTGEFSIPIAIIGWILRYFGVF